jgi:hypothetical protein
MTLRQNNCMLAVLLTFFVLFSLRPGLAQEPTLEPGRSDATVPMVSFDFEHPAMDPDHYAIAVQSTGPAAYRSEPLVRLGEPPGDPYLVKFTMSPSTCQRVFELAKQTNYFKGEFEYTKSKIANTGIKTLTYMEGHFPPDLEHPVKGKLNQTTYNWSENPAIQELTRIFQGISTTLEFGHRLDFERRFDKLGLDAELKRMAEMQKTGQLEEVQAIAPTLKNIANDVSVMHIARQRAQEILTGAASK